MSPFRLTASALSGGSAHAQSSWRREAELGTAAILDTDSGVGWALGRSSLGFGRQKLWSEVMTKATVVGCRRLWSCCWWW